MHGSRLFDKHFWLSLLIAAIVLFPRAALILTAHNECFDANYHLRRGLAFLQGTRQFMTQSSTDPPLAQAILALPMLLTGCTPDRPIVDAGWPADFPKPDLNSPTPERARMDRLIRKDVLCGNRLPPETLILILGLWKSLLFLPCVAVFFRICREVFGLHSAYLSLALLLVDPTFAAHIPITALDSFGVTGIVITCFLYWRYFQRESTARLVAAAIATAAALLMKHTAVILPCVFVLYAGCFWILLPWRAGHLRQDWKTHALNRRRQIATGVLLGALALWALLGFDVSRPIDQVWEQFPSAQLSPAQGALLSILQQRIPAGTYFGCAVTAWHINHLTNPALLFGRIQNGGFWYYFPALATFKIPLGFFAIFLIAIASIRRRKFASAELLILIPMIAWSIFLFASHINYSFRHFLPAYVFVLMWAGRSVAGATRPVTLIAWAALLLSAIHVLGFHPDYLSYINFPRKRIELQIADSNLDYGQALRQIDPWLAAHPPGDRPVYVMHAIGKPDVSGQYWLDSRVRFLTRGKPLPASGILIIFPNYVSGVCDEGREPQYKALWSIQPIGWVGHAMPVFNLDDLPH